jgi:nucleotide-binding universal stress UspA family protein
MKTGENHMRRILVPLDGSSHSAAILDDAVRFAGPGGSLVLMSAVNRPYGRGAGSYGVQADTEKVQEYLDGVAEGLRSRNVSVTTVAKSTFHVAAVIEEVAAVNQVDMIACATHSHAGIGRLLWGSMAWRVLSQSPVPVILRHPFNGKVSSPNPGQRRILVPLDGSALAEEVLSLAAELATEWNAPVELVRVTPDISGAADDETAKKYVDELAEKMPVPARGHVIAGAPIEELTGFVHGARVTDIVMASHGRGALARVFLGSVAYDIIHRLPVPVVVVPALASAETRRQGPSLVDQNEMIGSTQD